MSKVLREFTYKIIQENSSFDRKNLLKQNADMLRENFKRLKNFTGETDDLNKIYRRLGIQQDLISLSASTDSKIYDLVDIYELDRQLKINDGNWDSAWTSILAELGPQNDSYGAATKETVEAFKACFDQLRTLLEPSALKFEIKFEWLFRNAKGELLFIPDDTT